MFHCTTVQDLKSKEEFFLVIENLENGIKDDRREQILKRASQGGKEKGGKLASAQEAKHSARRPGLGLLLLSFE